MMDLCNITLVFPRFPLKLARRNNTTDREKWIPCEFLVDCLNLENRRSPRGMFMLMRFFFKERKDIHDTEFLSSALL